MQTLVLLLAAVIAPGIGDQIAKERALSKRGATKEARRILDQLIPTLRGAGKSQNLSRSLNDLSMLLAGEGEYVEAEKAAQEARAVSHQIGDQDGEARALDNLGVAELFLGSYPAAQASFAEELKLVRILKDQQAIAQAANNLGSAFFYHGNYTQALLRYEDAGRAVDVSKDQAWFSDWRQITDVNIATLYQRLGRFDKALQIYRTVQASPRTLSAADQAQLLSNLGALYRHLGDPYKALESYQAALRLLRSHNADGALGVLLNIGTVYAMDRNDLPQAAAEFRRVQADASRSGNRGAVQKAHLYLGETQLRLRDPNAAQAEFQIVARSATELGVAEDQWQAQYGLGRVEMLRGNTGEAERWFRRAIATIESVRGQIQMPALKAEFLAEKRDVYDALIRILLRKRDSAGVFEILERSRARVFQDRLVAKLTPLRLDEVQSHLDDSTLLLEFWAGEREIAVLWVTRHAGGVEERDFSPGEWSQLNTLIGGLPENLSTSWRKETAPLRALFPAQFAPFGRRELKHVLVVPDGLLSLVPIELAPLSSRQALIERYNVTYLPSAALLLRTSATLPWMRFPWSQQLAAFGAPSVGKSTRGTIIEDSPEALPGSEDEIRTIGRMIPGRAESYLGPRDNRTNFLGGAANAAPLLHVSTHGFADAGNPERTRLVFSPEKGTGSVDYVFLRELESLDVSRVDMATMSACDTERGKLIRGEGTQAFSRALLAGGARSTVTTLWRIGDAPAAEFMKQFYYFAVVKAQTKAEALRSAKLVFLNSGTALSNPQHWAAFVLSGDGHDPVPSFLSWMAVAMWSAGAVAGTALLGWGVMNLRREQRVYRRDGSG